MADNVTTQTTVATVPSATIIATDQVTYSGDAGAHIAPTSLVTISGSEGSKTATQVPAGGGTEATALRVTMASDSTGVLSVDDNGGSITVDGTVAISGSVTVATHDVGSITTAVVPGTGASNLGKAEDGAHSSGDVGVMALAVRQSSPANLSGANGDYEPLQVSAGRLWASVTVDAALPAGTNNIGDVDVLSVPAPLSTTGGGTEATALRVTVANDSTGVLSVDDNGGSLTVDGTVAVSGTVTVATHDVGSITTAVVPGTGASHLGKAEDAAHTSGDVGVMALAVRKDAAGTHVSTDGDYSPLQLDSAGSLRVVITGGAGSGGTSAVDESGYTPTSSAGTPIMGAADETSPDAAAEGTLAIIRATLNRALHVNLRDASGNEVAVGGGTQYTEDAAAAADPVGTAQILVRTDTLSGSTVSADGDNIAARAASTGAQYVEVTAGTTKLGSATDGLLVNLGANNDVTVTGTVTANLAAGTNNIGDVDVLSVVTGTGATNLGKAEDAAHADGDVGVMALAVRKATPANVSGTDGDYEPLQVSAGRLWASATIDAALPAGTNNIGDVDVLTLPGVAGTVAHDAADSGNPIKLGAKAKATLEDVTAVAADDRTDLYADLNGALITRPHAPLGDLLSERISDTGGTSTAFTTFGAPGAGRRNYITSITVHNAHATTNGYLDIRDGAAGSVLWTIPLPATGGAVVTFNPPLRQPTANTALAYDVSAAITTIYISVAGFQAGV